jgi:choline transport protein
MKQEIQSSDEKVWSDVESNSKPVSDDEALLSATGKVGELKR